MEKSPQAFRSIGEVARLIGVAPHVLRYWESQFPQLAPVKRADGRRYYRQDDVLLAAGIREMLHDEGLTIRGARRLIDLDKGAELRARGAARLASAPPAAPAPAPASRRRRTASPATVAQGTTEQAGTEQPGTEQTGAGPGDRPEIGGPDIGTGGAEILAAMAVASSAGATEPAVDSTPARDRAAPAPQAAGGDPPAVPDADSPPSAWLRRLGATAAALRMRDDPLPQGAGALAHAMRRITRA